MGESLEGHHAARVVVREFDPARRSQPTAVYLPVELGESLVVGREGDLPVGVDLADTGVSREAVHVTATADGFQLVCTNSNRAALYLWGQAVSWPERNVALMLRWPRIAVRVIGSVPDAQHWVLLESDRYPLPRVGELRGPGSTNTNTPDVPPPLTPAQLAALGGVFAQHLAWPPVAGPMPTKLEAVARRLGVTDGAVAQRLEAAQQRSYKLGSHRQVGVTDPGYLYVLVGHGYLPAPTGHVEAVRFR
jgi:hypothetical protein